MPIQINELASSGGASNTDLFLGVQMKRAGRIKGEATTTGHVDDIALAGWSWGVVATTAIGSTERTGRCAYRHLVVRKGIDAASTALLNALTRNDEVREAVLTMRKAGGSALDYFRMTLNGARVVDVEIEVGADGWPVERVEFAYTKLAIEYQRQEAGGAGAATSSFEAEVLPPG
jgi:type VI secretion system secreted protein Hcp